MPNEKQTKSKGNPNWVKGVSGNPNGRPPKGQALAEVYRNILEAERVVVKSFKDGSEQEMEFVGAPTMKHRMAIVLLGMALSGDIHAIREFADRVDGKPTQQIESKGNVSLIISDDFLPKEPDSE